MKKHFALLGLIAVEVVVFNLISAPPLGSIGDALNYFGSYFADILSQSAPILCLAFGMTLVLMTAGIDLSVASLTALVACVMASLDGGGGSFWVTALPVGLALAIGLGITNGLLISWLDLPPIIATLGTMIFYRGWCFVVMGDAEKPFLAPGYEVLGEFWFVLGCVALLYGVGSAYLTRSRWLQEILFIGGNRVAARYAGLRVGWRLCQVYAFVGGLAFLAAVSFTARNGSVSGSAMLGTELQVIVAVVLGGTRVQGGRGSLIGSFLGVLVIAILDEGLRSSVRWGDAYLPFRVSHLQFILLGLLLVLGVWINSRPRRS